MFITVRFGEDKQLIFNPNCRNDVLLHFIKAKCACHIGDTVDLSDETGSVKNLHKYPLEYGTEYFSERETLILLRVEKSGGDEDKTVYMPLLRGLEDDKEFIAKLNPRPTGTKSRLRQRNASEAEDSPKVIRQRRVSITKPARTGTRKLSRGSMGGSIKK